jgi:hypothetical protein
MLLLLVGIFVIVVATLVVGDVAFVIDVLINVVVFVATDLV